MITKRESEIIQNIAFAMATECDETGYNPNFELDGDSWSPNKLARELEKQFGIKTSSGMYRTAFILDNVVVKVSKNPSRSRELESEAKYIQKMKKNKMFGRHFPQTEIFKVGKAVIQIQEKVDMKHKGVTWELRDAVDNLANHLSLEDMHTGNYGWKMGKNGKYPVFVDVDFRNSDVSLRKCTKKRSWEV